MADSTTDYNNLDPLGDEAAVVDEVDAAVSGARKPRWWIWSRGARRDGAG
ncbi:MAG: hypothetical protein ACLU0O_08340 [Collinsella sp.]